MWRLFQIEIQYHYRSILLLVAINVIILAIDTITKNPAVSSFILPYTAFITPFVIFKNSAKEHKSRFYPTLPISLRAVAVYRVFLVVFSMAIFYAVYIGWQLFVLKQSDIHFGMAIVIAGLTLSIYGIGYIYRDIFREFIIRKGITREKVAPVLILIGIVLQVWLLVTFLQTKSGNEADWHIGHAIDWLIANFPFRGQTGPMKSLITGSVLALISIFTFERSKVRY
jgi:hypothetical protein